MALTMSLTDGQNLGIVGPTFAELSAFIFENGATPAGCVKAPGNPPPWVELSAAVSPNSGKIRVKQANIVSIFEQ